MALGVYVLVLFIKTLKRTYFEWNSIVIRTRRSLFVHFSVILLYGFLVKVLNFQIYSWLNEIIIPLENVSQSLVK